MANPPSIICIAGPTASGKSGLALDLARQLNADIINADALQVYDNWQVLTARPSDADHLIVPHRLYGTVGRDTSYSVGAWLRDVEPLLAAPGRHILVGGTGLYFTALTTGLAHIPPVPDSVRAQGNHLRETRGTAGFLSYLEQHDAEILDRVDALNPMRLQRAWEVHMATGRALSSWQDDTGPPLLPPSNALLLKMNAPPDWLNPRIEQRLQMMIADGALEECRANAANWDPERPSSRALGAAELIAHLNGQMTLDEALEKANFATRQYAKRQRTWFRSRLSDWAEIDAETLDDSAINHILSKL